jgi:hypothetical protein
LNGKGIERLDVGYTLPRQLAEYVLIGEEIIEANVADSSVASFIRLSCPRSI